MRQLFFNDPDVRAFLDWLVVHLPRMQVRLRLGVSPYVPRSLSADTTFSGLVPDHYHWRFTGMATGDWQETTACIRELSARLRDAVDRNDPTATRAACEDITEWGADRNARVGAGAYIASLGDGLPAYLRTVANALRLSDPDPTGLFRGVPRLNSMLCKIHALYAADGLPIYESRVAATIATLVEIWRRSLGRSDEPLPAMLRFPAVGNQLQRRVRRVFADAVDPGVLSYNVGSEIATAGRWSSAAVRVGLLVQETLSRSDPDLFVAWPERNSAHTPVARASVFIGAMFMAGYDPLSIVPDAVAA